MPETLTGNDIIVMIREAYTRKVQGLLELDLTRATVDNPRGRPIVGTGLRLKHKKSGLIYTVTGVGHSRYELTTPEGEPFDVGRDELEEKYVLD